MLAREDRCIFRLVPYRENGLIGACPNEAKHHRTERPPGCKIHYRRIRHCAKESPANHTRRLVPQRALSWTSPGKVTDEDGEEVTSCVVAPENDQGEAFRRALPPKSGNQRIIWDALGDVLKKSAHYGKAGAAPSRPCVTLEDAIEQTRSRLVCDSKRQTERTQSAISGLVSRGLLEFKEGWLWIA